MYVAGDPSVTSLSNSSGALANTYTYDSFGNLVASSGSLVNNFRYTGREFDTETGLYYYRARYYDPQAGRFVIEDPVRFKGGMNLYAYVKNDGVNWRDANGESPDAGTLANLYNRAAGALSWVQCAITAGYSVSGLPTVVDGLKNLGGNFHAEPSHTFDSMLNTADATHNSTASNLNLNQGCAANPTFQMAFQSCMQAAAPNPLPTPTPPNPWPSPPAPGSKE
jgi:RHS repeat-associated protein